MKVAFGMKAHSGWAALVAIGKYDAGFVVVDKCRIELVEDEGIKQPYHAAENLKPKAARDVVNRGIEEAHRISVQEMRAAVKRERDRGNEVAACAVLVTAPMPDWSTEEILAVHFRMHKAEGALFRDALARAAGACGLRLLRIPEKQLDDHAERALSTSINNLQKTIALLGKSAGPPWRKDQKDAALAALIALQGHLK